MPTANAIAKYEFAGQPLNIYGTPERPLFRASEVCAMLGVANVTDSCGRLDQDEVEHFDSIDVQGKTRRFVHVTESGLYGLVLSSRKPEAKAFRRWVTDEVLPAIRKTGSYGQPAAAIELAPRGQLRLILAELDRQAETQAAALAEHDARLVALESAPAPHQLGAGTGYVAIVGWLALRGVKHPGTADTSKMGRAASKKCKELGYSVCKEPDARYGTVNTYPIDVLDEVFLECQ
jgi:prophage antirepressor-like protein